MIFQDALSALNPVLTVGFQIAELFRVHRGCRAGRQGQGRSNCWTGCASRRPERVDDYPHQFSGGMRQRMMIAMALALEPDLLIADEPTTALDVTVQAQIMELLAELQREHHMGLILITHDLGVVAEVADRIAVMYAGRVVETAPVHEICGGPRTRTPRGCCESIPRLDQKGQELYAIPGLPPNLTHIPPAAPSTRAARWRRTSAGPTAAAAASDGAATDRGSACHFWKETSMAERDAAGVDRRPAR